MAKKIIKLALATGALAFLLYKIAAPGRVYVSRYIGEPSLDAGARGQEARCHA